MRVPDNSNFQINFVNSDNNISMNSNLNNVNDNDYIDFSYGDIDYDEIESEYVNDEDTLNPSSKYSINGEIDDYSQGHYLDCWLLGGLESFSNSEKGAQIIKDAVSCDEDGNYIVKFDGINLKIKISENTLDNARQNPYYSNGDDDILLMEIAFKTVLQQMRDGKIETPECLKDNILDDKDYLLDYGNFDDVVYVLTGNEGSFLSRNTLLNNSYIYDNFARDLKNDFVCIAVGFTSKNHLPTVINDINGNPVKLNNGGSHMWSVKEINSDTVVIINPGNSSEEITISKEDFLNNIDGFEYYYFK